MGVKRDWLARKKILKKKKKAIRMTEIKDSHHPRAEIKCGAGREWGASLIESLTLLARARDASS